MDIYTHDGLAFDVTDVGPGDGRVVILCHGFPEDRHCWGKISQVLCDAGYRVLAADQRGYSPGARPHGRRAYTLTKLVGDLLALADVAGAERFDLVGHDWGGLLVWEAAARHPDRVRTVTSLSVPSLQAARNVMFKSTQIFHSWYVLFFQLPWLPEKVFERNAPRLIDVLVSDGLDRQTAERYAKRFVEPGAMTGPINWYRAMPFEAADPASPITVPAQYVWSDGDRYVTRALAESMARLVKGDYRFEALHGESHWLPTEAADKVAPLILEHLAAHPD